MKFKITCPDCKAVSSTDNNPSGRRAKCPKCGRIFRVERVSKIPEQPVESKPSVVKTTEREALELIMVDRVDIETVADHIEGKTVGEQIRILAAYLDRALDRTDELFVELAEDKDRMHNVIAGLQEHTEDAILEVMGLIERQGNMLEQLIDRIS